MFRIGTGLLNWFRRLVHGLDGASYQVRINDMTSASLEQARSRVDAQEWTTERIVHELDTLDLLDRKFVEHCKGMYEELVPALLEAMPESEGTAKLNASLLLLHLDERRGTTGIIACLRSGDLELQVRTLLQLSFLPLEPIDERQAARREPPVPLEAQPILVEIKQFLVEPDSRLGSLALQIATKLDLPEAEAYIKPMLTYPSREVQTEVLNRWFARHCCDQGALQVAEDLLFGKEVKPDENYWVIAALETYCKCDRRELATAAAELLARFVRANADYPGNTMANLVMRALKGIEVAGYQDEHAVAESVLDSSVTDWRRGIALQRLAELDGIARVDELVGALSDRILRQFAADGLANIAAARNDQRIVEALLRALQEDDRVSVSHSLVNAVIAVGGTDTTLALEQLSGELPPQDAMRVFWLAHDISPQYAVQRLTQVGAISALMPGREEEILEQWRHDPRPMSLVYDLLIRADRLVWFDCETSMVHPDYVRLMEDLASISRGIFEVVSISQKVNPHTGESEIMFVHGSKAYRFSARDFDDWYDVESVLEGLNAALADSGNRERFIMLHTGDQTCTITFAPEVAFRQAARELRLPLVDDYQAAMKAGIAFQQYVRRKLKEDDQGGNP